MEFPVTTIVYKSLVGSVGRHLARAKSGLGAPTPELARANLRLGAPTCEFVRAKAPEANFGTFLPRRSVFSKRGA